ncbi:unnamed protein product [Triticum turgidum subsp. durum]|uniref:Protein kinase domain-containing protein n=1 Tax=Triticum turgidum subsp. durum TaxID=4567 RepID=A0A9R0ZDE9_TRITD|nr:unnamed protein product [Triticum turgidum subsp. durum]
MGGCYSAYACSRKLRGRLGNLSFVLPVTERDAAAASGASTSSARAGSDRSSKKSDHGSSRRNNGDGPAGGTEEEELVAKMTSAEFGRRYVLGKELGRGEFGVTRRCKDAATGEALACKTIRRHRRRGGRGANRKAAGGGGAEAAARAAAAAAAAHAADVRREVAIMRRMSARGGSAVVRLREAREDQEGSVHLVMELCEGGELFDRIVARGHYSERAAAKIFRTIVNVIQLCHSNGVIHRDLKPENFLFANKSEDAPLKVIDFGLSVFFNPGDRFTEVVGSAYYMAPEVLKRNYGQEVDVWSAGVILYILLCGVPPFWGDNDEKIAQAIIRGGLDFNREPWPRVSGNAKDLIRGMLDPDPAARLTAAHRG